MGISISQEEEYYTPPPSPYDSRGRPFVPPSSSPGGHKGLKNSIGENNCFLNVVVQSLWHLDSFRNNFGLDEAHFCGNSPNACVFCALKNLFAQYEFSEEKMIPPTALREALSAAFASESRFQVGEMYDAAETMVAVLQYLHCVQMGVKMEEEVVCEPPCCVHRVFGMNICTRTECECGATSEPATSSMFLHLVYVSELKMLYDKRRDIRGRLDALISVINSQEFKRCPDKEKTKCTRQNRTQRFIQNTPKVVSLSLVWATSTPDVEDIRKVLLMMASGELDLSELFYGVSGHTMYDFRGMIVYYGRHYYAFFFSRRRQQWLCFDDEKIKVVGHSWNCVIDNCVRSHCQPAVLFYEKRPNPNSLDSPCQSPLTPILSKASRPPAYPRSDMNRSSLANSNYNKRQQQQQQETNAIHSATLPVPQEVGGNATLRRSRDSINVEANGYLNESEEDEEPLLEKSREKSNTTDNNNNMVPEEEIYAGMPFAVPYKSSAPISVGFNGDEGGFGMQDQKELSTSLLSQSCDEKLSTSSDSSSDVQSPRTDPLIFDEIEDNTSTTNTAYQSIDHVSSATSRKSPVVGQADRPAIITTSSSSEKDQPGVENVVPRGQLSLEYVFDIQDMGLEQGKRFCIQRKFEAFGIPWRLLFERTDIGYIGVFIERLDSKPELDISVSFECTVTGNSFASSILRTTVVPKGAIGDPYFICPQRQKRFLVHEKYLVLFVVVKCCS